MTRRVCRIGGIFGVVVYRELVVVVRSISFRSFLYECPLGCILSCLLLLGKVVARRICRVKGKVQVVDFLDLHPSCDLAKVCAQMLFCHLFRKDRFPSESVCFYRLFWL